METKGYRMTLSSYRRIRQVFRGIRNETMADYFERLSKWLETMEQNDI